MKTELFIAGRLRLSPGDGQRRSPAVGIAVGGVALAVAVMIITIAVVSGFKSGIREKVMGFNAAITLAAVPELSDSLPLVSLQPQLSEAISEACPGASVARVLTQPTILKTPEQFAGVNLVAYDEGHDFAFERSNLLEGTLPEKPTDLLISRDTAGKLGLKPGDKLDACFFLDNGLKMRRLTVSGIYSSNFGDYDRLTAYVPFAMLQRLRRITEGGADRIELRGIAMDSVQTAATTLHARLLPLYDNLQLTAPMSLLTVFDAGAMYFNWLALLDANVVVILIIMALVSGFTLISCVFILILQRVRMIGILKSFGATNRQVRRIFELLGVKVVLPGMLYGNIVGLGIVFAQWKWHLLPLDPEAYYLAYVPMQLTITQILAVNLGALLLAALLLLVPATMVSRISPATTMRYQ